MECERLNRLVRSWYLEVQDEALAPGRMVEFMEKHIMGCDVCLTDPDVRFEVKKITEIVLPPSKMVKQPKPEKDEEASPAAPEANIVEPDNGEDDVDEEEVVEPSDVDNEV